MLPDTIFVITFYIFTFFVIFVLAFFILFNLLIVFATAGLQRYFVFPGLELISFQLLVPHHLALIETEFRSANFPGIFSVPQLKAEVAPLGRGHLAQHPVPVLLRQLAQVREYI